LGRVSLALTLGWQRRHACLLLLLVVLVVLVLQY